MGKIVFLISFSLLLSGLVNAQSTQYNGVDTFYIQHHIDIMTDKEYFYGSQILLCSEDGKVGFAISVSFTKVKEEVRYKSFSCKSAGIGSCVENGELIFLFEDNTKFSSEAWNDFNCDGNSYFDINSKMLPKLTYPLKAIRFTNGRTNDSFTYTVPEEMKNFFLDVQRAINKSLIQEVEL